MKQARFIVFFDGYCALCNSAADLLLSLDHAQCIALAPLQGETALRYLPAELRESLASLVWLEIGQKPLVKSEALLAIARHLPWPWRLLTLFRFLPRWLRDGLYDGLAWLRYRLGSRRASCRRPLPHERERVLP